MSSEDRYNRRGSGQRRPGPHQRRTEKADRVAAPAGKAAAAPHTGGTSRGHAPRAANKPRPGARPAPRAPAQQPTSGDDGEATVVVRRHGQERLAGGHVWVYQTDVLAHAALEGGSVVRVIDERGWFVGKACYGRESQIALRLLTREDEPIDEEFFARRLDRALALREQIRPDPERRLAARLVHGEADGLPGLVVDRYADCLSLQTLTEATEARKELFVRLLVERLAPRAIVERNDVKVREHEGLALKKGLLHGTLDGPVKYYEGEVQLQADLLEGQKTGAFLDQSENHVEAGRYAHGKALDAFSYSGGFALQLLSRCESVLAIDQSEKALGDATAAALRAGPERAGRFTTKVVNAFDFLKDQVDDGARWDTVVLDPPAFAKARGALEPALRGYKEINLRAFQLLKPGGLLVTCSCSFHVDEALFESTVLSAAADAGRTVQVVERRGAGRDHPTLLGVPETRYLKCLILRVL